MENLVKAVLIIFAVFILLSAIFGFLVPFVCSFFLGFWLTLTVTVLFNVIFWFTNLKVFMPVCSVVYGISSLITICATFLI